jgi:hypothetical protein
MSGHRDWMPGMRMGLAEEGFCGAPEETGEGLPHCVIFF